MEQGHVYMIHVVYRQGKFCGKMLHWGMLSKINGTALVVPLLIIGAGRFACQ